MPDLLDFSDGVAEGVRERDLGQKRAEMPTRWRAAHDFQERPAALHVEVIEKRAERFRHARRAVAVAQCAHDGVEAEGRRLSGAPCRARVVGPEQGDLSLPCRPRSRARGDRVRDR